LSFAQLNTTICLVDKFYFLYTSIFINSKSNQIMWAQN